MLRTTRCSLHTSSSNLFLKTAQCQNVSLVSSTIGYATGEIPKYQTLVHWRNYNDTIRILATPRVTENRTFEQRLFNPIGFSRFTLNPMYEKQSEKGFLRFAKKYLDIRNYIRIPGLKLRLLESNFYNRRQRILKGRVRDFFAIETVSTMPRVVALKQNLVESGVAEVPVPAQYKGFETLTVNAFVRHTPKKREVHGHYQRPALLYFNSDRYLDRKPNMLTGFTTPKKSFSLVLDQYTNLSAQMLYTLAQSKTCSEFKIGQLLSDVKKSFPTLAYNICTAELADSVYTRAAFAAVRYTASKVRLPRKRNVNTEFKAWWVRMRYKSIFDKVMQYTGTEDLRVTSAQRWQQRRKQYPLKRFQFRRYVQRERRKYRVKRSRYSASYLPTRKALAQMHNYRFYARRNQPARNNRKTQIARLQKQRRDARVRQPRWVERQPRTIFTRISTKVLTAWAANTQFTGQQLAARAQTYTY